MRLPKNIYFLVCFTIELSATITVGVERVMHDFYRSYGIDSSGIIFVTDQTADTESKNLIFQSKIVLAHDLIESIKSTGRVQEVYTYHLLYQFGMIDYCSKKRFGPVVGATSVICAGLGLGSLVSFALAGREIGEYTNPSYTINMYDVYQNSHGKVVLKLYNHYETLRERAAQSLRNLENSKFFAKIGGGLLAGAALMVLILFLIDQSLEYSDLEQRAELFVQKTLADNNKKI